MPNSSTDINEIRALLTDTVYEIPALGHDYSSGSELLIKAPTASEEGVVVFPCDRAGCEYRRKLAEGISELKVPIISNKSSHYIKKAMPLPAPPPILSFPILMRAGIKINCLFTLTKQRC